MDTWQQEYILRNMHGLTKNTDCHPSLMSRLAQHFSDDERASLETKRNSVNKFAAAKLLYELAMKKAGAYSVLMSALEAETQTGASQILLEGVLKHGTWNDLTDNQKEYVNKNSINVKGNPSPSPSIQLLRAMKFIALSVEALQECHMKGAEFNTVDENGDSILLLCVKRGRSLDIIKKVIEYGGNIHYETAAGGVLHLASRNLGKTQVLQFFLEKQHKMEINAVNSFGKTPLHIAVEGRPESNEGTQRVLITSGANVNATDSNNLTPFENAFRYFGISLDVIKLMEAHGLKEDPEVYSKALRIAIWNSERIKTDKDFGNLLTHLIEKGGVFEPVEKGGMRKEIFEFLKNMMQRALQSAEVVSKEILDHAKILNLVTDRELGEIELENGPLKNRLFYSVIREKNGERFFENVMKLLICNNQLSSLDQLRLGIHKQLYETLIYQLKCSQVDPFAKKF